jgi:NAD(P)-dependent dehydrogenase (short-subunit alcohol dehydrogenase family)
MSSEFMKPPAPSHQGIVGKPLPKGIMSLNRKVCIVTGGSSGFGEAVVKRLVSQGSIVTILDVNDSLGNKLAETLTELYTGDLDNYDACTFVKCDVGDLEQLKKAFDKVVRQYGTIDIMINNAGIGNADAEMLEALDPSKKGTDYMGWKKMMDINVNAMIYGTQLAVSEFVKSGRGKGKPGVVVNVASMAALFPQDDSMVYAAGKAAVLHFSRSMQTAIQSVQGPASKIRINTVCPAPAPTAMLNDMALKQSPMAVRLAEQRLRLKVKPWMSEYAVSIQDVAQAILQAIVEERLVGETIRVTPKGIDTWDHRMNKRVLDLKASL